MPTAVAPFIVDANSHGTEPPDLFTKRETNFPHPTCLYPVPLQASEPKTATLAASARSYIMGENARGLYRL